MFKFLLFSFVFRCLVSFIKIEVDFRLELNLEFCVLPVVLNCTKTSISLKWHIQLYCLWSLISPLVILCHFLYINEFLVSHVLKHALSSLTIIPLFTDYNTIIHVIQWFKSTQNSHLGSGCINLFAC